MFELPSMLENDLVVIKHLDNNDFETLYKIAADPHIWEQHPEPMRYQKANFKAYFDSAMESKSAFLLYKKENMLLMGCTRYYDYEPNVAVAIGYTFLSRDFWGGKYNAAVKELLIKYAFRFVPKVLLHIGASNIRSQKAAEKIGAKLSRKIEDFKGKGNYLEYEITRNI